MKICHGIECRAAELPPMILPIFRLDIWGRFYQSGLAVIFFKNQQLWT
jgi:hypothetical protein